MTDLTTFGVEIPRPAPGRYYDLVELPSRRHLPVPMVGLIIGWEHLDRLARSPAVRDERFFYCGRCAEELREGGNPQYYGSFFRCRQHRPLRDGENESKWAELIRLQDEGRLDACRYIESARWSP